MNDLHEIPQVKDSISYIYIEHAIVEQKDSAIIIINKEGRIPIPICYMTCLMIGEGTSVTYNAIKALGEAGCLIIWCNNQSLHFNAFGYGTTYSSKNLISQVNAYSSNRINIVKQMYLMRFPSLPEGDYSLEQLRGLEGVRMKAIYKHLSSTYGVKWNGRKYNLKNFKDTDLINIALSISNSLLYNICNAVILSLGYSPALGFIHEGNYWSFVYDIADLYKAKTTIPASFETVKNFPKLTVDSIAPIVRGCCRKYFEEIELLKQIPKDLSKLFSQEECDINCNFENKLWNIDTLVDGGINYDCTFD